MCITCSSKFKLTVGGLKQWVAAVVAVLILDYRVRLHMHPYLRVPLHCENQFVLITDRQRGFENDVINCRPRLKVSFSHANAVMENNFILTAAMCGREIERGSVGSKKMQCCSSHTHTCT